MGFWKETKRFFRELNKKLVETSPISSVPPFNEVKNQPSRGRTAEKDNPPVDK